VLAAKFGITHPLCIPREVIGLGANLLVHGGIAGVDGPQRAHQFFDFPLVQQALLVDLHRSFLLGFLLGIELARHRPQMLASMVEIDNLETRKWDKLAGAIARIPRPTEQEGES
jgi:hypothetical protein